MIQIFGLTLKLTLKILKAFLLVVQYDKNSFMLRALKKVLLNILKRGSSL